MLRANHLMGFGGISPIKFGVNFVVNTGVVATTDNPFTVSGLNLGSTGGTKHIILGINTDAEPGPISVVTIAGVTATIIIEEGTGVYKQAQTAIAIAQVTGVSSGDVVITNTSSNPNRYVISVFEMILGSATPTDTFGPSLVSNPTGTLDIVEGGFAIAVAAALTSSTFTWSGLTERFDATTGGTTNAQGHAWDTEMSAETGRTITATPSGSPSQRVGIGASFGPA